MSNVLVLGAGFGGLACAVALREKLPPIHDVTIVDRQSAFRMGLAKLQVLDGRRLPGEGSRALDLLVRKGLRFVQGEVEELEIGGGRARVAGREIRFDHVVVAAGAESDPGAVPGFGTAPDVFNLYAHDGVAALHGALSGFAGGRIVVAIASLPFKCPPAPYEAALLVEAWMRRRGVRARCEITVVTPEPQPLPVAGKECGDAVKGFLDDRGIALRTESAFASVDGAKREVVLKSGERVPYDVLALVPPHRAPAIVAKAGLAGEGGWIPIEASTGVVTSVRKVHAIGDCTLAKTPSGKPLPKAGIFAEAEGRVVAENLAARILGKPETTTFDGKGGCFMETGDGEAVLVEGDFFATPAPRVQFRGPSKEHLKQKDAFEKERLKRWFGA